MCIYCLHSYDQQGDRFALYRFHVADDAALASVGVQVCMCGSRSEPLDIMGGVQMATGLRNAAR